jgi:molybdopterin/thiamine biosynthesis adenylyltransferase/DNA-binding transcriptional regulator YhcF (GntR family)
MEVRPAYQFKSMQIHPITRKSLADIIAGKLAASIMDETLPEGSQLPPERDLIQKLEVSRSTLREALKILEEKEIIESRAGVGWFVKGIDASNFSEVFEIASLGKTAPEKEPATEGQEIPSGPRRLPTSPEKPIHIPNLKTDRLGTFDFISWWEREKVKSARVLVVGAGALGNEVIKNLALMGIGYLYIVDFDTIEAANLSRSPLFRESDSGRRKAEVAAARAKEINPEVHVQYLHGDLTTQLGLGVVRRMDVLIGCLDNREARLVLNRYANWMNKSWVDGAIQELLGLVRVFVPGRGACFECTLTEQARRDLATRYSCPLLARQNILLGKVPTTPTIASIIGAMQSQEALKLIHGLPVEAGSVIHFNGMTNHMHTTAYLPRPDCESHWNFGEIVELPMRANTTTFEELLRFARADLGSEAVIELDQEIILSLTCPKCQKIEKIYKPISEVTFESAHCPTCGTLRDTQMTHVITGEEPFLRLPLANLGIPRLHIIRAYNTQEYRFYELTGDLPESLHFNDFDQSSPTQKELIRKRIHLGDSLEFEGSKLSPSRGRIILHE